LFEREKSAGRSAKDTLFLAWGLYKGLHQRWAQIVDNLDLDGVAVVLHERPSPTQPDESASGLTLCAVFLDKARERIKRWMSPAFPRRQVEISAFLAPAVDGS